MIGKIMLGSGFAGCIGYCLEDKKIAAGTNTSNSPMQYRANVLMYNMCFGGKKELTKQFSDVRKLNNRQSKPVMHLTLSMAEGEILKRSDLLDMIQDCAKELGFADNQFLAVEHLDTHFQHIHIVANRIGFSGKTNVSDSNSFKRVVEFCRKMESKFELQEVMSPRVFLPNDQKDIPRNDKRKQDIKISLQQSLKGAKTMDAFCKAVVANGFDVLKSRGIAFVDSKGVKVKGSDIGLSLQSIERQLAKNNITVKPDTKFVNISQQKRSLGL